MPLCPYAPIPLCPYAPIPLYPLHPYTLYEHDVPTWFFQDGLTARDLAVQRGHQDMAVSQGVES